MLPDPLRRFVDGCAPFISLGVACSLKWRHSKEELKEEHAQAPHVHRGIVLAALNCTRPTEERR